MSDINTELREWAKQLRTVHLPRWEELPDIDLYMDQVMTLMERYLGVLLSQNQEKIITPAMVNNYVKLNLIPAPRKKHYNRVHLAYLIAITILKQVVTIKEVKIGILYQADLCGTRNAYNLFCEQLEAELVRVAGQIDGESIGEKAPVIAAQTLTLKMAASAFADKIAAEKAVALQEVELKKRAAEGKKDSVF